MSISIEQAAILQLSDFRDGNDAAWALVDRMRKASTVDVLEIAPGRWWLISSNGEPWPATADLPPGVAVLDLSSSRLLVRLRHPRWRDVVEKGCGNDLSGAIFATRRFAMTSFARFNLLLRATGDGGCDLYVPRSCAGSLVGWLEDALAEFTDPSTLPFPSHMEQKSWI